MEEPKLPVDLEWIKDGAKVWYQSVLGDADRTFAGVVEGVPWLLGERVWVVNLCKMEGFAKKRVAAASCGHLMPRGAEAAPDPKVLRMIAELETNRRECRRSSARKRA